MNANAEKPLIGMALLAFIDAVIVYFANRYALPFSIMWWCAVLSAGCAMWISRFCNRIYNSKQVKPMYFSWKCSGENSCENENGGSG